MAYLRQSTASQEILLGRFVDSTDGNTEKTALTIANTDIKIWKEGGTTLASKNSGGATHIANGNYYAVLDATDTDTVGKMEVHIHAAASLAVKREYFVLPAAVFDILTGALVQPAAIPAFPTDLGTAVAFLLATVVHEKAQNADGTYTLMKADGSTPLAESAVSDSGTELTFGALTAP